MHTSISVTSLLDFLLFNLVTTTVEMMTLGDRWSSLHLKSIIALILHSHFTNINYELNAKETVHYSVDRQCTVSLYLITYTV